MADDAPAPGAASPLLGERLDPLGAPPDVSAAGLDAAPEGLTGAVVPVPDGLPEAGGLVPGDTGLVPGEAGGEPGGVVAFVGPAGVPESCAEREGSWPRVAEAVGELDGRGMPEGDRDAPPDPGPTDAPGRWPGGS
ncbi:hypothetical protein [Streptomyces spinosirectus]